MNKAICAWTRRAALFSALALLPAASAMAGDLPSTGGLVETKVRGLDEAWLRSDVDFSSYGLISVEPVQINYSDNWKRSYRNRSGRAGRHIDAADLDKVVARMAEEFDRAFPQALANRGVTLATQDQPAQLLLRPKLIKFWLNHPDVPAPTRTEVLVDHAGEATLVLELLNARSGELIGWVRDRRETRNNQRFRRATRIYNRTEFRQLFQTWARITATELDRSRSERRADNN